MATVSTDITANLRNRFRIEFSIAGRLRFLSHLEIVDTLLSAMRRSGLRLALSQGMRPKPLIKVALPRPVAVEAWCEIVEIELDPSHAGIDVDTFCLHLAAQLPKGLELIAITALDDVTKAAASRVAGAVYRLQFDPADISHDELAVLATDFNNRDDLVVARNTPKQQRDVYVSRLVRDLEVVRDEEPPQVRFLAVLDDTGSVKPDEVNQALSQVAGRPFRATAVIRESIVLSDTLDGDSLLRAEPSLVGADVPEGPAKPWGAC